MRVFLAFSVIGFLVAAQGQDQTAAERKKLQGVWAFIEVIDRGKKSLNVKAPGLRLEFTADKVFVWDKDNKKKVEGAYSVDPKKKPPALDIRWDKDGEKELLPAVYELKGDVLIVCHPDRPGGARPAKIEATEETVLATLKRQTADKK